MQSLNTVNRNIICTSLFITGLLINQTATANDLNTIKSTAQPQSTTANNKVNTANSDIDKKSEIIAIKIPQNETQPSLIRKIINPLLWRQQADKNSNNEISSKIYLRGLTAFSKKSTDIAIRELTDYARDYPNGKFIAKVHFWLGEAYLQTKPSNYILAEVYFLQVVDKYNKQLDDTMNSKALYRLWQINKIEKNAEKTSQYSEMLKKKYPNAKEIKLLK